MVDINKTEIVCILDRSGSMCTIWKDMIGGLCSFIDEQKDLPGKANITMVAFDSKYDELTKSMDISKFKTLEVMDGIHPRGTTALYDAVGRTINSVGRRLREMNDSERPGTVLFFIVTDGYENSSREFSVLRIKEMIQHQTNKYNWKFSYLGANQDAFAVGDSIGIPKGFCANIDADSAGAQATYSTASSFACAARCRAASADDSEMDVNLDEIYRQKYSISSSRVRGNSGVDSGSV